MGCCLGNLSACSFPVPRVPGPGFQLPPCFNGGSFCACVYGGAVGVPYLAVLAADEQDFALHVSVGSRDPDERRLAGEDTRREDGREGGMEGGRKGGKEGGRERGS